MTEFTIKDNDFASLAGKSVVVTGGSSGIGLATAKLLLDIGASVVSGDLNPPPIEHEKLAFVETDVAQWTDLKSLFKRAKDLHGRIDHVFANAGISGRADYMADQFDEDGELLEPSIVTYDINLRGMINTSYLGIHYMRHQEPAGGSVVVTASASSFQRFRITDYTVAKHGVLGFLRGMVPNLKTSGLPIRINALSPSWTVTGMVPEAIVHALGAGVQTPEVVARSAVLLMADESRNGQLIYSWEGRYMEIEEGKLLKAGAEIVRDAKGDDAALERLINARAEAGSTGSLGGS
ncbi:hypothetical protein LTR36_005933 [Oleoguttula mirabilis]|uniref:Short-chain dehydrogenase n=1 Tax=Oleoguttula mirabilis TaxID=1507867 RepID=A0AAV9JEE7_9PEZI|nr:hypothetical protein LTR36_005933 [Oleoguttula mirabilis]